MTEIFISARPPQPQKSPFETDRDDAVGYHRSALQFRHAKSAPSVIFNVASIALERYLLAVCALAGHEPHQCTLGSLAREAGARAGLPAPLVRAIERLEAAADICSLEESSGEEVTEGDAVRALELCDLVAGFVPGGGVGHGSGRGGCGGGRRQPGLGCGAQEI